MPKIHSFTPTVLVLATIVSAATALDNGAALLPPLLVSTQQLGCDINQAILRQEIDQMVSSGLTARGFQTLLIDDCWQGDRDPSSGEITVDKNKFPSGLPMLIFYARSQGIGLGLGTDISSATKSGKPGSMGFQKTDANTYASWGITLVSVANSHNLTDYRQRFIILSGFVQETSKKIAISIDTRSSSGVWAREISNFWTLSSNSVSNWDSFYNILTKEIGQQKYADSGSWNDPGFINPELPFNQFSTQVAVWMALKAPIKLNSPLSKIDKNCIFLLLNQELLAISQDPLKRQAKLIQREEYQSGYTQVWGGQLDNDRWVFVFVNERQSSASISVGIETTSSYEIRDPISHQNLGSSSSDTLTVPAIPSHSAQVRIIHF